MQAVQRFGALLLADLRERSRGPRFWALLGAMMLLAWFCIPPATAGYRILSIGHGVRADYSSAWIGMVLAMAFNLALNLGGFYMVRGTLVRDIETRVWQLLVATTMTRSAYLLAKWASHMLVFGLIVSLSLCVGLAAQWLRAEDHNINLIELAKPILLLSLPGFAFTSLAAIWFDLVPWLRRTAGNIIFFVLWISLLSFSVARMETPGSSLREGWMSDPGGLVLAARDLHRVHEAQTGKAEPWGMNLGGPNRADAPPNFQWTHWQVRPMDLLGRAFWLILSILGVMAAAPFLDWAAARGLDNRRSTGAGRRLRWLDWILAPMARAPLGLLMAAELKAWLRDRRAWWWGLALLAWGLQAFAPPGAMSMGLLLAWILPIQWLARSLLQEFERRTGALVFTASGIATRLLMARFLSGFALLLALTLPALLRLSAHPMSSLALLAVAASIASWGLALAALTRNARAFELLLVATLYIALQGVHWFDVSAAAEATALTHALGLLPAWCLIAWFWPRLTRA